MELNLHLPTLMVLSIVVNTLIGALLWAVYHLRERQACFRTWACACLAFVLGATLAGGRAYWDLPVITVFMAHLALGASPLLVLVGIHSLVGLPALGGRFFSRLLGTATLVYTLGLLVSSQAGTDAPRWLTALYSVLLFSLAIYRLARLRRKPRLPFRILQALFATHGALMMAQVLVIPASAAGIAGFDLEGLLTLILANHLLLATATMMALPLLAFTEAEFVLRALADRDELTQLFNRRAFFREGVAVFERARRAHHSLTVLMIDLDHFKQINDRWGHRVGDDALRFIAGVMEDELRDGDILGRIGGEEFAAVLNTGNREEVDAITHRLLQQIARQGKFLDGRPLNLSASIGGVAMTSGTPDFDDLVQRADAALYNAKNKGRNRVEFERLAV